MIRIMFWFVKFGNCAGPIVLFLKAAVCVSVVGFKVSYVLESIFFLFAVHIIG